VKQPLSSGDTLWVYSDGVTEARSGSGELFGAERLLAAVKANTNLPAAGPAEGDCRGPAHNFGWVKNRKTI